MTNSRRFSLGVSIFALSFVGCSQTVAETLRIEDDGSPDGEGVPDGEGIEDDAPIEATYLLSAVSSVRLAAPKAGTGVGYVAHFEDGTSTEAFLEATPDGRIQSLPQPSFAALSAPLPACQDTAYNLYGTKWTEPYAWRFHSPSTPKINAVASVEAAIVRSVSNVVTGRNNCGRTSALAVTASYLGRTKVAPNIRLSGQAVLCDNPDGKNIVGFGKLPGKMLGLSCLYWIMDDAGNRVSTEGDVRLDSEEKWYAATTVPKGCSGRYMIEGVATHEFGHIFGLGHVPADHANLTMSPRTSSCTNRDATLGLGDLLGLQQMY